MITKLLKKNGETLIETLSALAIVVLAMFLLSNMLIVASRQNIKSTSITEAYQQDVAVIEGGQDFLSDDATEDFFENDLNVTLPSSVVTEGTVKISVKETSPESQVLPIQIPEPPSSFNSFTIKVNFISSSDGKLTGYEPYVSGGGGN